MSDALKGRLALVTGSSRGIGAAIARRLAEDGAGVVIHCNTNRERADALAREIGERGGVARVVQADLQRAGGAEEMVEAAFAAMGQLDILVNNAGVFEGKELQTLSDEQIDRVLAVNVRALLIGTREFAARTQTRNGRIINISSVAGGVPVGGSSLYAASKAAVNSLTRSHATELGARGITVNAVAPGTTETDMSAAGFPQEVRAAIVKGTALGRFGRPEDIARVVAFLCSDEAGWVTGQVIGVDGGMITGALNMIRLTRGE